MPLIERQASLGNGLEQPKQPDNIIRYFTPNEVRTHNHAEDCWLSWLGRVYDLTPLVAQYPNHPLVLPLLEHAGQDISHWFDEKTGQMKTHIHPETGCRVMTTPFSGRTLHMPPAWPRSDYRTSDPLLPWWQDSRYSLGQLSQKTQHIRIINVLTSLENDLEVCSEESLLAIQDRYLQLNCHARAYVWKRLGRLLDMTRTLAENGVVDEEQEFERLGQDDAPWIPVLHVYFADDLTVDPVH